MVLESKAVTMMGASFESSRWWSGMHYGGIVISVLAALISSPGPSHKQVDSELGWPSLLTRPRTAMACDTDGEPPVITNRRVFSFPISNAAQDAFGYDDTSDTEVIGPNCIAVAGDLVFIGDPLHECIKRIDCRTGAMTSSDSLPNGGLLYELTVWNGRLYTTNWSEFIYALPYDLSSVAAIKIGDQFHGSQQNFVRNERCEALAVKTAHRSKVVLIYSSDSVDVVDRAPDNRTSLREVSVSRKGHDLLELGDGRTLSGSGYSGVDYLGTGDNACYDGRRLAYFVMRPDFLVVTILDIR